MNENILAIDASNTHTSLALWLSGTDARHWRVSTDPARTSDEHRVLFAQLLEGDGLSPEDVTACVLGCVVPELTPTIEDTCRALFGVAPLVVRQGVRSGLRILTDNPRELGADRIANAVAASARFGNPVIVLDFGTALTVDVVGPSGDYVGAIIAPGIEVAADALARRTARLGRIELVPPPRAIASDTDSALQSGIVYGYLGLVEGLVARVRAEIGDAPVVATGEEPWLRDIIAQTEVVDTYEPLLTLDGLRRIYERHHAAPSG
jgi:type III pantothenate kinase